MVGLGYLGLSDATVHKFAADLHGVVMTGLVEDLPHPPPGY